MPAISTWMPLYIGDYLADTQHLSAEEHGAYLLLLMYYWKLGRPVPAERTVLENITHLPWKRLANVLPFFTLRDGLLVHKRVEQELARATLVAEKNRERTRNARSTLVQRSVSNNVSNSPGNNACNSSTQSPVTDIQSQPQSQPPSQSHIPSIGDLKAAVAVKLKVAALDLRDFEHLYHFFCALFGRKQFSHAEQETLAAWNLCYDMEAFVLPVIIRTLDYYRSKHNGAMPRSLAYFNATLQREDRK